MSERVEIERTSKEIAAIIGAEHIRAAASADSVEGLQPAAVIAPGTALEVAQVLRCCDAASLTVIPRGGGTKLSLGNLPRKADFVLSTERLNKLVEHAFGDMTATVEAGCTIAHLQNALREHGQQVAFDPRQPESATVGGVLATAESGTLRIRYGALRDLVLGLQVALPDGSIVNAGGKVVKNVAGYDLTKLAIGSLGTVGVITRAVFRLHPVAVATVTQSVALPTTAGLGRLLLAILDSNLVFTGLQVRATRPDQLWVDIRFEGIPDSLNDQILKLAEIARGCEFHSSGSELWAARQEIFANSQAATVCKCSVLPAQLEPFLDIVFSQAAGAGMAATVVAQATGLAEVRLEGGAGQNHGPSVNSLRAEVQRIGGTLVVQQCPTEMKQELDVWGPVRTLPLMRRIKDKFDPAGTLNPGRFVGGL